VRDPGALLILAVLTAFLVRVLWRELVELLLVLAIALMFAGVVAIVWLGATTLPPS
jgi:hypothetical protein